MRWICVLALALLASPAAWGLSASSPEPAPAGADRPVPGFAGWVTDPTGRLQGAERDTLRQALADLQGRCQCEIAALVVDTTEGEDVVAFGRRVGNAWQSEGHLSARSALITIAIRDRAFRISLTRSLEGEISESQLGWVIEQMQVRLRAGELAQALSVGGEQLVQAMAPGASAGTNGDFREPRPADSARPLANAAAAPPTKVEPAAAADEPAPPGKPFPMVEIGIGLVLALVVCAVIWAAIETTRCPACRELFAAREVGKWLTDEQRTVETVKRRDKHLDKSGNLLKTVEREEQVTVLISDWEHDHRCTKCEHTWRTTSRTRTT